MSKPAPTPDTSPNQSPLTHEQNHQLTHHGQPATFASLRSAYLKPTYFERQRLIDRWRREYLARHALPERPSSAASSIWDRNTPRTLFDPRYNPLTTGELDRWDADNASIIRLAPESLVGPEHATDGESTVSPTPRMRTPLPQTPTAPMLERLRTPELSPLSSATWPTRGQSLGWRTNSEANDERTNARTTKSIKEVNLTEGPAVGSIPARQNPHTINRSFPEQLHLQPNSQERINVNTSSSISASTAVRSDPDREANVQGRHAEQQRRVMSPPSIHSSYTQDSVPAEHPLEVSRSREELEWSHFETWLNTGGPDVEAWREEMFRDMFPELCSRSQSPSQSPVSEPGGERRKYIPIDEVLARTVSAPEQAAESSNPIQQQRGRRRHIPIDEVLARLDLAAISEPEHSRSSETAESSDMARKRERDRKRREFWMKVRRHLKSGSRATLGYILGIDPKEIAEMPKEWVKGRDY
ncbi:MAG: hypothetical protein M1820_004300 [Bogoriella megaspora]|nr:MAG: hypothetical protein M1820_004300 [Bogoriella megaspora]